MYLVIIIGQLFNVSKKSFFVYKCYRREYLIYSQFQTEVRLINHTAPFNSKMKVMLLLHRKGTVQQSHAMGIPNP